MAAHARSIVGALLLAMIQIYRWTLAYVVGGRCRFYPSCSRYGEQAIRAHGPARGLWLTVRRIARCHPWNPGGVDEVPPPNEGAAVR